MRNSLRLILAALLVIAAPAYAHPGTVNVYQHFFEHILIAMIIGIPLVFGLVMYFIRRHDSDE